MSVDIYFTS